MSDAPRLNSLFRIQTILILDKEAMSGYDLAKALEDKTGNKPSSGKIYPFLHQLQDSEYIEEVEIEENSDRSKKVYSLTDKGHTLVDELLERMGNILDARLIQMLDVCASCDVQLYEAAEEGIDIEGNPVKFCCTHCKSNFYRLHGITE